MTLLSTRFSLVTAKILHSRFSITIAWDFKNFSAVWSHSASLIVHSLNGPAEATAVIERTAISFGNRCMAVGDGPSLLARRDVS
jgi:hypothetical protein